MNRLEETFRQLCRQYTTDEARVAGTWQKIAAAYMQPGRHYHTLRHLEQLLDQLDYCQEETSDSPAVLFALYYHDISYNTLSSDNEARSAVAAVKAMNALGIPDTLTDKTAALIIATKTHERSADKDTNLFTDADLSILGMPAAIYEQYTQQVRNEYSMYPDMIYLPGRRKVLMHFLEMDRIYKTDLFADRYEQQARRNIQQELELLK